MMSEVHIVGRGKHELWYPVVAFTSKEHAEAFCEGHQGYPDPPSVEYSVPLDPPARMNTDCPVCKVGRVHNP
jgi:hypothetical protein